MSFYFFRLQPSNSNLDLFSLQQSDLTAPLIVRDSVPSRSYGIVADITVTDTKSLEWTLLFQCLSNPLWFPIACLCCLPVLTFALLMRESLRQGKSKQKPVLLPTSDPAVDNGRYLGWFDRYKHMKSTHRLLLSLFVTYYSIFMYDLVSFGKNLGDGSEETEIDTYSFTHSVSKQEGGLEVIYVFRHWTGPLAAVIRNVLVAVSWRIDSKYKVLNI